MNPHALAQTTSTATAIATKFKESVAAPRETVHRYRIGTVFSSDPWSADYHTANFIRMARWLALHNDPHPEPVPVVDRRWTAVPSRTT